MSETTYNLLSLLRWTILAGAVVLAGGAIGEGLATQGERAVQRHYDCTMKMQEGQLERLFREPRERG